MVKKKSTVSELRCLMRRAVIIYLIIVITLGVAAVLAGGGIKTMKFLDLIFSLLEKF